MKKIGTAAAIIILAVTLFIAMPFGISAEDYSSYKATSCPTEGASCAAGEYYYHEGSANFVNVDDYWQSVEYTDFGNSDEVFVNMAHEVRNNAVNYNASFSFIVATDRNDYNEKIDYGSYTADQIAAKERELGDIFELFLVNELEERIYDDSDMTVLSEKARAGDYLRQMLVGGIDATSALRLEASDYSPYSYYLITFNLSFVFDIEEELEAINFLNQWQTKFIDNNALINSAGNPNIRNFYVVKTIYNFLTENTLYDTATHDKTVAPTSDRYRRSHTMYGALFGNIDSVSNYSWNIKLDSQGIARNLKYDQGLSVCEGYSLVTYYLCKLNGIDCKIVAGDFINYASDPHVWNLVKLDDSLASSYQISSAKWYHFDATYSASSKIKVKVNATNENDFRSFVDYTFFLRGTSNSHYQDKYHQQQYPSFVYSGQSSADYSFTAVRMDASKCWVMVTRSTTTDSLNINKRIVFSPTSKMYEMNSSGNYPAANTGFVYDGNSYNYFINVRDYAEGVEYTCNYRSLKNRGDYTFSVKSSVSTNLMSFPLSISPIDMSKALNYKKITWNKTDITGSFSKTQTAYFTGSEIKFSINITDCHDLLLTENTHYSVKCCKTSTNAVTKPILPDNYYVLIDFDFNNSTTSNYTGKFKINFKIVPNDIKNIVDNSKVYSAPYRSDFSSSFDSIYCKSSSVVLKKGVDYSVKLNNSLSLAAGKRGSVTLTGLSTSKYVKPSTTINFYYDVTPRDLSSISGAFTTYSPKNYTGSEIKLTSSTISLSNGDVLKQGTDYTITGYSDNVKVGTATATIKFKGNYKGTTTATFKIYSSSTSINSDAIKLTAVSSLKAKASPSSVKLSWKSQGEHVYYEVYVYDTGYKKWQLLAKTSDNSYKSTFPVYKGKKSSFKANKTYKYRVRSTYTATINGKTVKEYGDYTKKSVVIPVKAPTLNSVTAKSKAFTAKWTKVSKASGYELSYSTSGKFASSKTKTVTISKAKTVSKTVKKLKSKKTYYVRIRAYSTVNGKKVYSSYSKVIKVKTK